MALVEEAHRQRDFRKGHTRHFRHQLFSLPDAHLPLKFTRSPAKRFFECGYQVDRMNVDGLCQSPDRDPLVAATLDLVLHLEKPTRNPPEYRSMLPRNVCQYLEQEPVTGKREPRIAEPVL